MGSVFSMPSVSSSFAFPIDVNRNFVMTVGDREFTFYFSVPSLRNVDDYLANRSLA
jgi:hypothetical protein